MRNISKLLSVCLVCLCLLCSAADAHSGRTDANGGHWNRKTGEYHYHHGYPAHQHPGGVCPYIGGGGIVTTKAPSTTKKPSTTKAPATTVKPIVTTAKPTAQAPRTTQTTAPRTAVTEPAAISFETAVNTKSDTVTTDINEPLANITSETDTTSGKPVVAANLGVENIAPIATTAQRSDAGSSSAVSVVVVLLLSALIIYLIVRYAKHTDKK